MSHVANKPCLQNVFSQNWCIFAVEDNRGRVGQRLCVCVRAKDGLLSSPLSPSFAPFLSLVLSVAVTLCLCISICRSVSISVCCARAACLSRSLSSPSLNLSRLSFSFRLCLAVPLWSLAFHFLWPISPWILACWQETPLAAMGPGCLLECNPIS